MNKEDWKKEIKRACEEAETYKPFFDNVIDTLASILEKRDKAQEQFEITGGNPTITYTNKAKETNIIKNPVLVVVNELNRDALAYWKELCLTPSALKKVNEEALKDKKVSTLATVLKELS